MGHEERLRNLVQQLEAVPESTGSRIMRTSGWVLATAMRACPPSRRFRSAVTLAHLLEPLIARTRGYRERQRLRTDTVRETSLEFVLMMLTRHRTTFTPQLTIDGLECLPRAGAGPTLIVGPHTMLSRLFVRHLEEAGHQPAVIDAAPQFVPGTRRPQRILLPSPALLLKVRGILQQAGTVAAMIDRDGPEPRNRLVQMGSDAVFVSDALLQLALKQQARIVFIATTLDEDRRVVVKLEAAPEPADTVDAVIRHFASFVERALSRSGAGAVSPYGAAEAAI